MIEGITPTEAAERLGVPPTTLVTWLDELPIPRKRDDGGLAWLDEDALAVLEAVRGMRAYDLGFQTIRRHLETLDAGEPAPEAQDTLELTVSAAAPATVEPPVAVIDPTAIADAVARALGPVLGTLAELQGAQGRELQAQARLIGQLEADNAFVRRDRDRIAGELVDARRRVAYLEAHVEMLQARPRAWWRFWA